MSFAAYRLAELDRISRERPLTDEEQQEVVLRARQDRRNRRRKELYWSDEERRQKAREQVRQWRQSTPRYWERYA